MCRFRTLLRFSWHAMLVNIVNCVVLALAAHQAATAQAGQAVVNIPVSLTGTLQLPLHSSAAAAAPVATAATPAAGMFGNSSNTQAGSRVAAAAATLAKAAVLAAQTTDAAAAGASISGSRDRHRVTGLLASLAAWVVPAAWLLLAYLAVARNSSRLQLISTATMPMLLLLPVSTGDGGQ